MSAGVPAVAWPRRRRSSGPSRRPGITNRCAGRARGRPSRGASTVSAIASNPASSAWSIRAPGDRAVAEAVELEPARRAGRRRRDLGRGRGREGRQHHDRAGRRGRARHPGLAVGMGHALERDRRDQQRHRDFVAEHRRRGGSRPPTSTSARGRRRQWRYALTFSRSVVHRRRRRRSTVGAGVRKRSRAIPLVVGHVARLDGRPSATAADRSRSPGTSGNITAWAPDDRGRGSASGRSACS